MGQQLGGAPSRGSCGCAWSKEGDEIEISIAEPRDFQVARDPSKQKALKAIRRLARPFPPGFKFDREEAKER
jgi:antitoxin MazE